MRAPSACGRRSWRAPGGMRKRWRTVSSPSCSTLSAAAPWRSTRPRRRPSTWARPGSTRRAARRSRSSWRGSIATCSAGFPAMRAGIANSAPRRTRWGGMSHRREIALAALLAIAVTVAVLAGRGRSPSRESAFERRTSAFLAGPRGSKASYDVLARLGVPVERRRRPLFGLAREGARRPGLLVVLDPPLDLQAAEIAEVVRYVRGGGAVLAAGDGGGIAPCAGWVPTRAGQGLRDSLPVVPRRPELRLPAVASVLKPVEREKTPPPDASCPLLVASGADTLLAGRDGRPVVLRLRYPGGGQVTLAADPGYFRNIVWRQTGVAAFAVPLFLAGRRGAIVWDEFHQRFGRGGSLTAKTLLVRSLALALDVRFQRIQFTPDLMPADITGISLLTGTHEFTFRPGPIFADLVLADEINRAPAKTQAALLEAMQERTVTMDGTSHALSPVFTVFATQNPVEFEGTYPLPEAELDRFMAKVQFGYPPALVEQGILTKYVQGFEADRPATYGVTAVTDAAGLERLRHGVEAVRVEPQVTAYITAIVRATRDAASLTLGASPRAGVSLLKAARAARSEEHTSEL